MAGEKTEKPTPKKRADTRKKGQVARSADLSGGVVLLAGIIALGVSGPATASRMADAMGASFAAAADPGALAIGSLGSLVLPLVQAVLLSLAPVALTCAGAGVVAGVAQVGFKPSAHALKPDPKRINPLSGAKNIFGPNAPVEALKSVSKVGVVAAVVAIFVGPQITSLSAAVGMSPIQLGEALGSTVKAVALRAAFVYVLIGIADYAWQRHRHEKSLKMDVQEIKEEHKGQELSAEVRSAIRRRQVSAARARMMADVPQADVIVTNPTHFAVALRYEPSRMAPEVVAKGQDLVAQRIKQIAAEHDVPVVEDKPLARGLHAACEVGQPIPEELYAGVAGVLAWVYRTRPARPRSTA